MTGADALSGPVAVCVDRPLLALDRPFTYLLPEGLGAGVGSLVSVPFHGRAVRGWVLGPTDEVPPRVLPIRRVLSPVRFFDRRLLDLLGWVSERYVAPLAAVIARSHPPRVASEEDDSRRREPRERNGRRDRRREPAGGVRAGQQAGPGPRSGGPSGRDPASETAAARLRGYPGGGALLDAVAEGRGGAFLLRPAPEEEVAVAVEAVGACLAAGRTAIVLVPEAEPLPATAAAILRAFAGRAVPYLGGDRRERYRTWLDIRDGRYGCVVGTRPAVFAPVAGLGLVYLSRESHPAHREERAPYYHVRDVALARARLEGATCVLAALCPSGEAAAAGIPEVRPPGRPWPPVEVVRPGPEGRAPRLLAALRSARRAFVYEPLPGYGVARVCRSCGEPATCAHCGGVIRLEGGSLRCVVCRADGRCAACGARAFGVRRGGVERVEEWLRRLADVPVRRIPPDGPFHPAGDREVTVGGPEAVKDHGPLGLDLVGILDADLAARRPGLAARERSLSLWMEAAAWARPGGRVIVQSSRPSDPGVQALVTGNPTRFYRVELPRRARAGFPAGFPVFRVVGTPELPEELARLSPLTLLTSAAEDQTVCLLTVRPEGVPSFGRAVRRLAERGVVSRVEAEPHL